MSSVTEMLAKTHSRYNKGRNRILTAAVCLCILTLTIVFGIASGKIEAEYLKAVREVGTTASACIEKGDKLGGGSKCVGVHSKTCIYRRPRSLSDKRARNDVTCRCIKGNRN